jgi:hypothetical protein
MCCCISEVLGKCELHIPFQLLFRLNEWHVLLLFIAAFLKYLVIVNCIYHFSYCSSVIIGIFVCYCSIDISTETLNYHYCQIQDNSGFFPTNYGELAPLFHIELSLVQILSTNIQALGQKCADSDTPAGPPFGASFGSCRHIQTSAVRMRQPIRDGTPTKKREETTPLSPPHGSSPPP